MASAFSINHGAVTAVLGLSSQNLEKDQSRTSNGLLYVFYTLSALTFASGLVQATGTKMALCIGLLLYCFYVGSFLVVRYVADATVQWIVLVIGASVGGFAAGWLWTAQGSFFARTCQLYNDATGTNPQKTTGILGGIFAFIYVGFEVILKAMPSFYLNSKPSSAVTNQTGVNCTIYFGGGDDTEGFKTTIYIVYTIAAVISAAGMFLVRPLPTEESEQSATKTSMFSLKKLFLAVDLLFSNLKMACLVPLNMTFGLVSALVNSYINSDVLGESLHDSECKYKFLILATIPLTAFVLSMPFAYIGQFTGKLFLMLTGAVSYVSVSLWILISTTKQFQDLGTAVAGIYVVAGVGRAIFEGTNKAVFADFFPKDKEGAFANVIIQNGFSSSVAFFLFPSLGQHAKAGLTLGFAVITIFTLIIAFAQHKKEKRHAPLLDDA